MREGGFCAILIQTAHKLLNLNGEMSEWSIEHAWKSDRFTRADAHQILPTHVGSISSRYNEVLRDAPVNHDVHGGFRGVCDTVLTQSRSQLVSRRTDVHSSRTEVMRDILHRAPLRLAFHIKNLDRQPATKVIKLTAD